MDIKLWVSIIAFVGAIIGTVLGGFNIWRSNRQKRKYDEELAELKLKHSIELEQFKLKFSKELEEFKSNLNQRNKVSAMNDDDFSKHIESLVGLIRKIDPIKNALLEILESQNRHLKLKPLIEKLKNARNMFFFEFSKAKAYLGPLEADEVHKLKKSTLAVESLMIEYQDTVSTDIDIKDYIEQLRKELTEVQIFLRKNKDEKLKGRYNSL